MTGEASEPSVPVINITNSEKNGETEFPVVRAPDFFQVTPAIFSVWADVSAPPTFDIALHKPIWRETTHVFKSDAEGTSRLARKNVTVEISELGRITCGLSAAIGLFNQLKNFLDQVPQDVRAQYATTGISMGDITDV